MYEKLIIHLQTLLHHNQGARRRTGRSNVNDTHTNNLATDLINSSTERPQRNINGECVIL